MLIECRRTCGSAYKCNYRMRAVWLSLAAAASYSLMGFLIKLVNHDSSRALIGLTRFAVSWIWVMLVININLVNRLLHKRNYCDRDIAQDIQQKSGKFDSECDRNGQYGEGRVECGAVRDMRHKKHFILELLAHFSTSCLPLYFSRAFFTVLSVACLCVALKDGSMANVMALVMSQALFVPLVERILYKRSIGGSVMMAMVLGFIGVVISLKPSGNFWHPSSIWGLLSGVSIAISYVNLREVARHDQPYTIMSIHFSLVLLINLCLFLLRWRLPVDGATWLWLLLMGVAGTAYQEFITRAMRIGPASLVSTLQYSSIVIGSVLGWVAWREMPAPHAWFGASLIVAGSILTVNFSRKS